MRTFCAYSDRNYLYRAMALHESLAEHSSDFELWILCFDAETFDLLNRLSLPGVRPVTLEDFEAADPELKAVKPTRKLREYYWTSTAPLLRYVLQRSKPGNVVSYLDSDLFFFSDPAALFEELGAESVLIVEHRYARRHQAQAAISGVYNVGTVLFRDDEAGRACLEWWRQRCLEWCYAVPEPGRFGDQKYLDEFPGRFPGVQVARHPGLGLAPWNISEAALSFRGGAPYVSGMPAVFYHFHSLAQLGPTRYEMWAGKYHVPGAAVRLFYHPYLAALGRAQARVASVRPEFSVDYSRRGPRSMLTAWLGGRLMRNSG